MKFGKLAWWYQPRFWLLARWRPYRPNIEDLEVLSSTFGTNQNHTEGFGTVHASNGKTPLIWVWDGNFPKRARRNLPKRLQKVWVDQFDEFISKRLEIKNDKNILVVGWLRLFYTWQPAAIQHHHINPPQISLRAPTIRLMMNFPIKPQRQFPKKSRRDIRETSPLRFIKKNPSLHEWLNLIKPPYHGKMFFTFFWPVFGTTPRRLTNGWNLKVTLQK